MKYSLKFTAIEFLAGASLNHLIITHFYTPIVNLSVSLSFVSALLTYKRLVHIQYNTLKERTKKSVSQLSHGELTNRHTLH